MQVCHGKAAPLRRIQPGDGVAYYSPTRELGGKVPYRAFTAVGIVTEGDPFLFDMGDGFKPWRRKGRWEQGREVLITPLLPELSFAGGQKYWGRKLRFGLLAISEQDFGVILSAMADPE